MSASAAGPDEVDAAAIWAAGYPRALAARRDRRLVVPEVVQTSAMDCGPAALKSLLEGFGIRASYGRLREACQADIDGTSINALEDVVNRLGLEAEQVMMPIEHLLLPEANALPAIVVVRLPKGFPHFVVVWRTHGPLVQVMNPASGRIWRRRERFVYDVFAHSLTLRASEWRQWTEAEDFHLPLRRRMRALGIPDGRAAVDRALAGAGWREMAALDATTRMVESMRRSGATPAGPAAARLHRHILERARSGGPGDEALLPAPYWTVLPAAPSDRGEEQLQVRGCVLVRVQRPLTSPSPRRPSPSVGEPAAEGGRTAAAAPPALSRELAAVLEDRNENPAREFFRLLRPAGLVSPATLLVGLVLVAGASALEALLFRSLLELVDHFGLVRERLGILAVVSLFLGGVLLVELAVTAIQWRLGRHLDMRFRFAFLRKLPLIADRYLGSRPTSDMAERTHSLYLLHLLLRLCGQLVRVVIEGSVTALAVAWIHPRAAVPALIACTAVLGIPLLAQIPLIEQELRMRMHGGALGRFYLDALLGLVPIRAHGGERAIKREHEALLVEWARAGRALLRSTVVFETAQKLVALAFLFWLVGDYVSHAGFVPGLLLLVFWGANLTTLGNEITMLARQYPTYRNVAVRLLDPLGAPEEPGADGAPLISAGGGTGSARAGGVELRLDRVEVVAAGHTLLRDIDLAVPAGAHVAIVGRSGAGKTSLVGTFLGWHRPRTGEVRVDGAPLHAPGVLPRLRRELRWVDPAVQLWNRSCLENLAYGNEAEAGRADVTADLADGRTADLAWVLREADLLEVLQTLPEGLQTGLGESGGLISGGEGQRVRLGRAFMRPGARLVVLDEAFRGLDRARRHELLRRARALWSGATLLCVTHDVGDTLAFERVLVLEGGTIVEDGAPRELLASPGSRYGELSRAEDRMRATLGNRAGWRRLTLEEGRLEES